MLNFIFTWYLNDREKETHHKCARNIKLSKDFADVLQSAQV